MYSGLCKANTQVPTNQKGACKMKAAFRRETVPTLGMTKPTRRASEEAFLHQTGKEKQWIQRRKEPRRLDGEFLLVGDNYNLPRDSPTAMPPGDANVRPQYSCSHMMHPTQGCKSFLEYQQWEKGQTWGIPTVSVRLECPNHFENGIFYTPHPHCQMPLP